MKGFLGISLIAMFSLLLMGCPYESTVPIGEPSIPIENRFLGVWVSADEVYHEYIIYRISDMEYGIAQTDLVGGRREYRAFMSQIKNVSFLNVYSDSLRTYFLYRVDPTGNGDMLTLRPVSSQLPDHFGSPAGLRTFVERSMNLRSFYDERESSVFTKKGDVPRGFIVKMPQADKPVGDKKADDYQ